MSYTRAQFRLRVQRRMDAVSATRWNETSGVTGEIDQVMGHVFRKEWKRILNANRQFRVRRAQPTTDTSGRVTFTVLGASLSSDTEKNAYRIIQVMKDGCVYKETPPEQGWMDEINDTNVRTWFREGDKIAFLPVEVSTAWTGTSDGIWVSWIPTGIEALSTDAVTVDFPDGYEEIVALESAALLLTKGGAETGVAREFKVMAEELRQDMLQDVARTSTRPQRMRYEDDPAVWAG